MSYNATFTFCNKIPNIEEVASIKEHIWYQEVWTFKSNIEMFLMIAWIEDIKESLRKIYEHELVKGKAQFVAHPQTVRIPTLVVAID